MKLVSKKADVSSMKGQDCIHCRRARVGINGVWREWVPYSDLPKEAGGIKFDLVPCGKDACMEMEEKRLANR